MVLAWLPGQSAVDGLPCLTTGVGEIDEFDGLSPPLLPY